MERPKLTPHSVGATTSAVETTVANSPWKLEFTDFETRRSGSPVTTSWKTLPGLSGWRGDDGFSKRPDEHDRPLA
jgi:hypothetical protein